MSNIITLRSVYKVKTLYIEPCKMANGQNFQFVKPVQINADGSSTMILSEKERNSPDAAFFIPENEQIMITEGTTFNLDDPLEKNRWDAIKNCELIVPMRDSTDVNGDRIIDGNSRRYGLAEFYVDVPGEESKESVNKKKLIHKAHDFIYDDSLESLVTKCKLLGKNMRNAPSSDVTDYLLKQAEKTPAKIIELYTSSDTAIKLLIIDAKEKGVVRKIDGLFMYGDSSLGQTDDSMLAFLKTSHNLRIMQSLRDEVYPGMVKVVQEEAKKVVETNEKKAEEKEAPKKGRPAINN